MGIGIIGGADGPTAIFTTGFPVSLVAVISIIAIIVVIVAFSFFVHNRDK